MTTVETRPLCPLPKGYYWRVELIARLNTVHLALCKTRSVVNEKTSACVVLDALEKPVSVWAELLVLASYSMWEGYTVKDGNGVNAWRDKVSELSKLLGPNVQVRVEK